jgi:hypothetical protein
VKNLIIILFLLLSNLLIGQNTAIPDTKFEQALINLGYDVVLDGQVLTANINTILLLDVSFYNIGSLVGIQDFTNLIALDCTNNLLTSLNVTQNIALSGLDCRNNQITSLDVSQNIALTELVCQDNQITSLDVSQNIALTQLWCTQNLLTNLNVTQNTSLALLYCSWNQLLCLNMKNGNNPALINGFSAHANPNLTCIEVDNVAYSTANWINIDAQTTFSNNCSNGCYGVGIGELGSSFINIYPNPTDRRITLSLEERTPATITIRNSLGQLLLSEKHPSSNEVVLDISIYPIGLYFLEVEADGKIFYSKILKK